MLSLKFPRGFPLKTQDNNLSLKKKIKINNKNHLRFSLISATFNDFLYYFQNKIIFIITFHYDNYKHKYPFKTHSIKQDKNLRCISFREGVRINNNHLLLRPTLNKISKKNKKTEKEYYVVN